MITMAPSRPLAPFTPTPQVRAASVNEALRRVAAMGQSPDEACRRASITAEDLEHDDRMVSLAQAVALFEECARLTGDAHFGLHLGATTDHGMLGDLSYVARHSPTVGKALHNIARYAAIQTRGVRIAVELEPDAAYLSYDIPDPRIWPRRHDIEASAGATTKLLRSLLGPTWRPKAVHFEHDPPDDLGPYDAILAAPIRFRQPSNVILVDRPSLDAPIPGADERLLRIVENHIAASIAAQPQENELVREVRSAIARSLSDGDVSIAAIARVLGVSQRTLQRRLSTHGIVYRNLVDEIRHDLAIRYLRDDEHSLTETAYLLGYSEQSAFNRAFRRWTGTSPLKYASQR